LQRLRGAVEQADYVVGAAVYHEAQSLFTACLSSPQYLRDLQQLAPEYGKPEFLLCVDSNGSPVYPTGDIVEDFRKTVTEHPSLELWFQEATVEEDERPVVLLIARWLCHLVGFRHRSVHLFIDHPTRDDYTLVQVRGIYKFESPGCFDIPVAGHVVGLESTTDTLYKELEEELNLDRGDIYDPEMVGSYDYRGPSSDPSLRNVEFRVVFRSRLKAGRLFKIGFVDREVAAISVFALSELDAMINTYPERVASGLARSFPICLRTKSQ
jgi:isopentenyldiphosphate isomerase